jgi:hypothetical protein
MNTESQGAHVRPADGCCPLCRALVHGALLRVELSDGTWVSVESSAALTASTFAELLDYLTVYEKVLQKRAASSAAAIVSAVTVEDLEPRKPGGGS